jgi:hypothetical protein
MVATNTQKRLKPSDQRLKERLKYFAWSRDELLWLSTYLVG